MRKFEFHRVYGVYANAKIVVEHQRTGRTRRWKPKERYRRRYFRRTNEMLNERVDNESETW